MATPVGTGIGSGGGRRSRPLPPLNFEEARGRPGFFSRGAGNLQDIVRHGLPGLFRMAGAIPSDTINRAVRAAVPGGSRGDEPSAIREDLLKPVGESLRASGGLLGDVAQAPAALMPGEFGGERRSALAEHGRDFWENPGFFTVEHLGNAALVGGIASKPLAAGARARAGATKPTVRGQRLEHGASARGARVQMRDARQTQLRQIADSGEAGSGLARASLASRNVIGRPYTAALRKGAGARLPAALTRGDAGPSHSVRETYQQFRESAPVRINPETGSATYVPNVPVSPVARQARQMADTDLGVGLRNRVGAGKRAGSRMVEDVREAISKASSEGARRSVPAARKSHLPKTIKDMANHAEFAGVIAANPSLAALRKQPHKWTPEEAAAASQALEALDPATLPRHLAEARDGLVRDLYEVGAGLEEGTLSRLVEPDIHLGKTGTGANPDLPYAEAIREAQRFLEEKGIMPDSLRQETPGLVDPALAQGPARAGLPEHVQRSMDRTIESNTTGEAIVARELRAGEADILKEDWAPIVRRNEDGSWRAPTEGEVPLPLTATLTPAARRGRAKLEQRADQSHKALAKAEDANPLVANRATVETRMNKSLRELTRLARAASREKDAATRAALRDEFVGAKTILEDIARDAGTRIPDNVVPKLERLHLQVAADLGKHAEIVPAARAVEQAYRSNQKPVVRLETRAAADLQALERARLRAHKAEMDLVDFDIRATDMIQNAPAKARPRLEIERGIGRQMDQILRANGYGDVADRLGLVGAGSTLQQMNNAGVTPGYLGLLTDPAALQRVMRGSGDTLRAGGKTVHRGALGEAGGAGYDLAKFEQDLKLTSRIVKDEMFDEATRRYMRGSDSLAAELGLDMDWWKSASAQQRAAVLQEQGFVRWDKNAQSPVNATGPTQAGDSWVHRSIAEGLDQYARADLTNTLIAGVVNPSMRLWKGVTLAMRPAWQLGNMVSDMFMASIHGQIDPISYMRSMTGPAQQSMRAYRLGEGVSGRIKYDHLDATVQGRLTRQYDEAAGVQGARGSRLRDADVSINDTARMVSAELERARRGNPFQRFIGHSYALNNYIDNLNRITVMLAHADGPKGMSGAIELANEALGDYVKMSKFERQYVKAAFPFWAWQRHITVLSARQLSPDNITRTVRGLHLADLVAEQDEFREMLPGYQKGALQIGTKADGSPRLWNNRNLNPFQDALEPLMMGDRLAPTQGISRQAGPIPAFLLERASGTSTFTGRPFTSANPRVDEWGRNINEPPPLGEHMFQSFGTPLGQVVRDLGRRTLGRPTARYQSGEAMLWEDTDRHRKTLPETLAGPVIGQVSGFNREAIEEAQRRTGQRRAGRTETRRQQEEEALANQRLPFLFRKP